jgi:hypothetical protein
VWDARRHGWRCDGPYVGHDSGGSSTPVFLFMESIQNATDGALVQLLHDYPQTVTIVDDGRTYDYLSGQTKPLVADPKVPFAGLAPM